MICPPMMWPDDSPGDAEGEASETEPMGSWLLAVAGLEKNTTLSFRRRLATGARALGLDPSLIAAVMSFETGGTFSPKIRAGGDPNAAVGLIQWTKSGAAAQGTTKDAIARMSAEGQLDLALKWFEAHAGKLRAGRACDYYLAVFWPNAIGWDLGRVLPMSASAYAANKGLDRNLDGSINVAEACSGFGARIKDARTRPMLWVPGGELVVGVAALALLGLGYKIARSGWDR